MKFLFPATLLKFLFAFWLAQDLVLPIKEHYHPTWWLKIEEKAQLMFQEESLKYIYWDLNEPVLYLERSKFLFPVRLTLYSLIQALAWYFSEKSKNQ